MRAICGTLRPTGPRGGGPVGPGGGGRRHSDYSMFFALMVPGLSDISDLSDSSMCLPLWFLTFRIFRIFLAPLSEVLNTMAEQAHSGNGSAHYHPFISRHPGPDRRSHKDHRK